MRATRQDVQAILKAGRSKDFWRHWSQQIRASGAGKTGCFGEGSFGSAGPADTARGFGNQHSKTSTGENGGTDEAVVSRACDQYIALRRLCPGSHNSTFNPKPACLGDS